MNKVRVIFLATVLFASALIASSAAPAAADVLPFPDAQPSFELILRGPAPQNGYSLSVTASNGRDELLASCGTNETQLTMTDSAGNVIGAAPYLYNNSGFSGDNTYWTWRGGMTQALATHTPSVVWGDVVTVSTGAGCNSYDVVVEPPPLEPGVFGIANDGTVTLDDPTRFGCRAPGFLGSDFQILNDEGNAVYSSGGLGDWAQLPAALAEATQAVQAYGAAIGDSAYFIWSGECDYPQRLQITGFGSDAGPVVTVASPLADSFVDQPVVVSGNAADVVAPSGVDRVQVAVRALNGDFIQGPQGSINDALLASPGADSTDFSIDFGAVPDGRYHVFTRATDGAGNTTSFSFHQFTVGTADTMAPSTVVETPAPGAVFETSAPGVALPSLDISGTATDDISGVVSVQVALRNFDGNYIQGPNGRIHDALVLAPGEITSDFVYNFADVPAGNYHLFVRAIDAVGTASSFSYERLEVKDLYDDVVAPTVFIDTPEPGEQLAFEVYVEGEADDFDYELGVAGSGIAKVQIAFRNQADGSYVQGSSGIFFEPILEDDREIEYAFFSMGFSASQIPEGDYHIFVRAIDLAGNASAFEFHQFSIVYPS